MEPPGFMNVAESGPMESFAYFGTAAMNDSCCTGWFPIFEKVTSMTGVGDGNDEDASGLLMLKMTRSTPGRAYASMVVDGS